MADFVAHLGVTFFSWMGLETHCWLLGYELVADLLSHLRFSSVGWGVMAQSVLRCLTVPVARLELGFLSWAELVPHSGLLG